MAISMILMSKYIFSLIIQLIRRQHAMGDICTSDSLREEPIGAKFTLKGRLLPLVSRGWYACAPAAAVTSQPCFQSV